MNGKQGKNGKGAGSNGSNSRGKQCYCNGSREVGTLELYCNTCCRWFHSGCLQTIKNFNALPFMVCYTFQCMKCSPTSEETWMPKKADFSHMCLTALANMTQQRKREGSKKFTFSLFKEIIPYVDDHWTFLTSMPRRVKSTWHQTLHRAMAKESELFCHKADESGKDTYFGLVETDLSKIGPNWEVVKNLGRRPPQPEKSNNGGKDAEDGEGPKTRGAKRKAETQSNATTKRTKGSDSTYTKFSGYAFPVDHPFNRDGYRYYLAEPDKHAPNRLEFDEKEETAGKPIPAYMYRVVRPSVVELSSHDRAPQLKLWDDHLSVTGEKGYSVIRASHAVSRGSWYFELAITEQPEGSHVRLGWSQPLGCLQAPVGYDKFSYSWRSRKGTRFHDSIGKHYSESGFSVGDTLGCYIHLPAVREVSDYAKHIPASHKDLPLIKFKHHYYYEEKDESQKAAKELRPLQGSKIMFYRNGTCQGVAFRDINEGLYHPAISIYKSATVRANFGPSFKFPPRDVSFAPMSQRAEQLFVEQSLSDILFFCENEGKLTLDL